jgi:hypothetical protein
MAGIYEKYYNYKQFLGLKTDEELFASGHIEFTLGDDQPWDIYYRDATGKLARLPKGDPGTVLSANEDEIYWGFPPEGGGGGGANNYPTAIGFNTSTGVLTLDRNGMSALTVDLDGRYLQTGDGNDYVDGASFNTGTRVLTLTRTGALPDLTVTIPEPDYVDTDNYVDGMTFDDTTRVLTLTRTGALADLTVTIPSGTGGGAETDPNSIHNQTAIEQVASGRIGGTFQIKNVTIGPYTSVASNDGLKFSGSGGSNLIGIQNTHATGYSGIEYMDAGGTIRVFTGHNNANTGEFRFNNTISSGVFKFLINGTQRIDINSTYAADFSGDVRGTGTNTFIKEMNGTRTQGSAVIRSVGPSGNASSYGAALLLDATPSGGDQFTINATGNTGVAGTAGKLEIWNATDNVQLLFFDTQNKMAFTSTTAFNQITPGLGSASIHGVVAANNQMWGLTSSGVGGTSTNAQSGIYFFGNSGSGNALFFATTNNYGIGSQMRMKIAEDGAVQIGPHATSGFGAPRFQVKANGTVNLGSYTGPAVLYIDANEDVQALALGTALYVLRVNAAGTGLEFAAGGGAGDGNDYVDSVSFNTADGVLTLGRTGALADLTVDLDGRYELAGAVVDTDNYVDSVAFNTSTGVLTLGRTGALADLTVDLDGRYLESLAHTHTIANSAGTSQFTFSEGQDIRFEGTGATSVTFDAATRKVTISSTDTNTDTNNFPNGLAFDTGTGILSLGRSGMIDLTVDLDGRYQLSGSYITGVAVAKAGTLVGTRPRINFIEGTNITLTIADDNTNGEVDVTIAAVGGTDTNDYVDSVSFNTSDGVLTLGRTGALADLTVDLDGRWQPLDADLTAIAGLAGTTGLLRKTAADTWSLDTNTYLTANQAITLTGEVTGGPSATSIATTVTNAAVIGKTLASFAVGSNTTITSAMSILEAFQVTQGQLNNKQALDADLTAIAGLAGTTGLLRKTAADTWSLDTTAFISGVAVAKNSGATVGTRPKINFIEGTNVTLTIADDSGNGEVDVTIASAGGSPSANNGLTVDTGVVQLGGNLIEDTQISGQNLYFLDHLGLTRSTISTTGVNKLESSGGIELINTGANSTTMSGGLRQQADIISSDTTLGQGHLICLVDASAANRTITLPDATLSANGDRVYTIKKIDSSTNTVTIDPNGSQTIDGQTTFVIGTQYQFIKIVAEAGNWYIIG